MQVKQICTFFKRFWNL